MGNTLVKNQNLIQIDEETYYYGKTLNDKPQGLGFLIDKKVGKYYGEFQHGKKHGFG